MISLAPGWIGAIDPRDRNLLIGCGVLVTILIVALAFFSPSRQDDEDPTPYSYSTGERGAKAAFELLTKAGYAVERQNAPLSEIIDRIDEHTTLVIAEPYMQDVVETRATVKQALDRGARVLVTGPSGALLVPSGNLDNRSMGVFTDCEAEPNGFGEIANSGKVRMRAMAYWQRTQPLQWVEYTCNGLAVVVRYASGKGEVIWWASSFPLENAGLQRADNLALFLNSIGPVSNHVFWDESLHGDSRTLWSYADGTPVPLLWGQLALIAILLLFSYSRRSGPLRPDPVVSRATPLEFVHSLGSLYQKAGATNVAIAISYQRFRHQLEKQFAVAQSLSAENPALLQVLSSRFAAGAAAIQKHLLACENAAGAENLPAREALALVQALYDDEALIRAKVVPDKS
jgi:hypothetical protein